MPIALIMRPPAPTTIPFCDALSTQISARTRASPARGLLDLLDDDLHGVGHLLESAPDHRLAHELGQQQLARLIGALARSEHQRSLGHQPEQVLDQCLHPRAGARGDRKHLAVQRQPVGLLEHSGRRRPAQTVHLVDRDRHRQPGPRERSRDEPVARTDSLLPIEDQQRGIGAFELLLHPPGHARGERVARALHARQVDQHDLGVPARTHAPDRPARGLRAIGDDRDLLPHDGVHERRLADVRAPRERDEAAARHAPALSSSWACSASISPSSVS